jgi:hypothetical protein
MAVMTLVLSLRIWEALAFDSFAWTISTASLRTSLPTRSWLPQAREHLKKSGESPDDEPGERVGRRRIKPTGAVTADDSGLEALNPQAETSSEFSHWNRS